MNRMSSLLNRLTHIRTKSIDIEARALYFMAAVFIVSLIISFLFFAGGSVPIFGAGSVGIMAIILSTAAAAIGYFSVSYQQMPIEVSSLSRRIHLVLTTTALSFVHAAIVFLLTTIVFYTLDSAFTGLTIDVYSSSILASGSAAVFAYGTYLVASRLSTLSISTALAIFLVVGALTSMISSSDPYWWQYHLSYLGGGHSFSSYAFEITLAMGGLVMVCIADFIARDFARLKERHGKTIQNRANIVRVLLMLIGIFLALVGLFRWNVHPLVHNTAASGMVLLFLTLIVGLPYFVPMFSKAFFVFSYSLMGALLFCVYLYWGASYFNLTAFEILAFMIVFGWLVVFVRQIAAALADQSSVSTRA